jgi:hypothetical protein
MTLDFLYQCKSNSNFDQDQKFEGLSTMLSCFCFTELLKYHAREGCRSRAVVSYDISAMENTNMQVHATKAIVLVCGIAAALLIAGAMSLTISRPASALPAYAQQTGKACGFCHQNPAGGGALKPAGEKFKANDHKL